MVTATATTATKKEKVRLKNPLEMSPEELEAYNKKTDAQKAEYEAKLAVQTANDQLAESRQKIEQERAEKKAASEKEKAIKDIVKDVKAGTLEATPDALKPRFEAIKLPVEEYEKTAERIKQDSTKTGSSVNLPAKPAYELKRELRTVAVADLEKPEGVGVADSTLANSVRRYGQILPIVVRELEGGKYRIMDGQRRYSTIQGEESVEVMVISGFPDEDTAERAEVTLNRVRSLNIVAVSNSLTRMRTRGIPDTEIRRDMGFKTGEIDKLTSVQTNLIPALREGLNAGNITPSVALNIAKLPKAMQEGLGKTYAERLKATPNAARISENDVEQARQSRAADAAKRDNPTLAGLAGSVKNPEDAPALDESKKGNVTSNTKTPAKGKTTK